MDVNDVVEKVIARMLEDYGIEDENDLEPESGYDIEPHVELLNFVGEVVDDFLYTFDGGSPGSYEPYAVEVGRFYTNAGLYVMERLDPPPEWSCLEGLKEAILMYYEAWMRTDVVLTRTTNEKGQ